MIAITLVAGAAIFGFVNGQSSNSAQAVGNSAAQNINFLNEKEVVLTASNQGGSKANVYVYNSGSINPDSIVQVVVTDNTLSTVCVVPLSPAASVPVHQVATIEVSSSGCGFGSFQSGHSFTFQVVGVFGNTAQATVGF